MRILLDTHALIWWLLESTELTASARAAILDPRNEILTSAVSAFEIAQASARQAAGVNEIVAGFDAMLAVEGFGSLDLTREHGLAAGSLAWPHKDPFDRLLVAQALVDDLVIISNEKLFDATGVRRLW